jgi:acyl-CoA thioesterase FadM
MAAKLPAFVQRHVVGFHETDAAGFVHFTNIFRWMEAAEHAFLKERGVPVLDKKHGWPRVEVCAHFYAPLRFGDEVETRLYYRVRNPSRLNFCFEIWRVNGPGAPERAGSGQFTTVRVRRGKGRLKRAPLPARLLKKLPPMEP